MKFLFFVLLFSGLKAFSGDGIDYLQCYEGPVSTRSNRVYRKCLNLATMKCEMGITVDFGPHKGLCFDDKSMKAVKQRENPSHLDPDRYLVIDNFSHNKKYFTAVVDLQKITEETPVYGQLERFKPKLLAAHGQMRYDFENGGVKLYKNFSDVESKAKPEFELKSIVTSIEAMRPYTKEYGIMAGAQNKFLAVFRVKSLEDVIQKAVDSNNKDIDQYKIFFKDHKYKKVLLKNYFRKGSLVGYGVRYHTLVFNCVNGLFMQAQDIMDESQKKLRGKWKSFLPVLAPSILKQSRILEKHVGKLDISKGVRSASAPVPAEGPPWLCEGGLLNPENAERYFQEVWEYLKKL